MKQRKNAAQPGDTFAVPLGNGLFGAVRVLRVSDGQYLLAVTRYLGNAVPPLFEEDLRVILIEERLNRGKGRPEICWYEGPVPEGIVPIGNLPVTAAEEQLDPSGRFGGEWLSITGKQLLLVRGMEREHGELVSSYVKRSAREPTHSKVMARTRFWKLIDSIKRSDDGEPNSVEPLIQVLVESGANSICAFRNALEARLSELDTPAHRACLSQALGNRDGYLSDDHFTDVRLFVIASGRRAFEKVLAEPEALPVDRIFEELEGVADKAHRAATGKPMP